MKITKTASLLLLLSSCMHINGQMNSGKIVTEDKYLEIAYSDPEKFIELKAGLKGGVYPFFMDSGSPTFISAELQKKFNYPVFYHGTAVSSNGQAEEVTIVTIDTIKFGPFIFENIPALVFDQTKNVMKCYGYSGNIGSNILRFLTVRFDIQKKLIYFTDDASQLPRTVSYYPLKLDGQSNAFISVKFNEMDDIAAFDTGDGTFYHVTEAFAGKFAQAYKNQVAATGNGITSIGLFGIGKPVEQYVLKPATLQMGGKDIKTPLVYTTENRHATIGRSLLNYGVLQLDYMNSRYSFDRYAAPPLRLKYDFGFHIVIDKKRVIAGTVWRHSMAEQRGMKSGDEILSINGVSMASIAECDLLNEVKSLMTQQEITIVISKPASESGTPVILKGKLW